MSNKALRLQELKNKINSIDCLLLSAEKHNEITKYLGQRFDCIKEFFNLSKELGNDPSVLNHLFDLEKSTQKIIQMIDLKYEQIKYAVSS